MNGSRNAKTVNQKFDTLGTFCCQDGNVSIFLKGVGLRISCAEPTIIGLKSDLLPFTTKKDKSILWVSNEEINVKRTQLENSQ